MALGQDSRDATSPYVLIVHVPAQRDRAKRVAAALAAASDLNVRLRAFDGQTSTIDEWAGELVTVLGVVLMLSAEDNTVDDCSPDSFYRYVRLAVTDDPTPDGLSLEDPTVIDDVAASLREEKRLREEQRDCERNKRTRPPRSCSAEVGL